MADVAIVVSIRGSGRTVLGIVECVLDEIQLRRQATGIASRHQATRIS
jgi:hypothetical protein